TTAGQEDQRQGGSRASQNIAVAGQRSSFNHFTLDGVENTDVNFNTYVILPSIDALQEFKVQTGIFPAEFGRATTQINASTKPGTNQFHGTLFEFLRNDKLDAKQYAFAGERPKHAIKWNQYARNLIPNNRINSVSNNLLELYPARNLNPNMVPYNYEATLDRKADKDQFIQRIDFTESSKSSWFGRYSWSGESESQPYFFNGSQVQTHVHQAMASNTRVISPSKVNEFRFGFNYFYNLKSGIFANTRDVMSELNLPGISRNLSPLAWGTPHITITGFVLP